MESQPDRHLSWNRFEALISAGPPAVEPVAGTPRVEIFTDPAGARIGIRIFCDVPALSVPLAEMSTRATVIGGQKALEVSTANADLYREFYGFACTVADEIQVNGRAPAVAVESSLASWSALVERLAILTPERQIGLLGELWALQRLAAAQGWDAALEAWNGPYGEEHDFSKSEVDIEVKTTMSERRVHMIGSLTQLLPSPGRSLYILSLQYTRAGHGPGKTLTEAVDEARSSVAMQPTLAGGLSDRLERIGWNDEHAPFYRTRWAQRRNAQLVPVDAECPAIVPATLASLGAARLTRLVQVSYRVDLEGLGSADGSAAFADVLP